MNTSTQGNMTFTPPQERFMRRYLQAIESGDAAVFAGAGLSMDSGLVDWATLLRPIAEELGLKVERERDMVALAQFYVNEHLQNRRELNQLILEYVGINAKPNRKHQALARLPIDTYWTINYDKLLEKALEAQDKVVDIRYTLKQLNVTRTRRDAVVYKMHGDVDHPDDAVLIRDDYEGYHVRMAPFISSLVGDLLNKKFLFLGLSFEDPNLNFVLGRIRAQFSGGGGGEHFCLMRSEKPKADEDDEDFKVRKLRQNLLARDLKRFNITVVFVEEYREMDLLLEEIERRYRRRSVLISGSAHTTDPWSPEEVEDFVSALAEGLVDQSCRVVTGFGKGIGHYVVTGALTAIYRDRLDLDRALLIRPFPHAGRDTPEAQTLKERHRQELVGLAGIAVFLFGNRLTDGEVAKALGVRREFEIALEQGLVPLPVGGTGWMSGDLHREVLEKFDEHFPHHGGAIRPLFEAIGAPPQQLREYIQPILQIVHLLKGGQ